MKRKPARPCGKSCLLNTVAAQKGCLLAARVEDTDGTVLLPDRATGSLLRSQRRRRSSRRGESARRTDPKWLERAGSFDELIDDCEQMADNGTISLRSLIGRDHLRGDWRQMSTA